MTNLKLKVPQKARDFLIRIVWPLQAFWEFMQDGLLFVKFASFENVIFGKLKQIQIETQSMKDLHGVEKGLSLKSPKKPFGLVLLTRMRELDRRLSTESIWKADLSSAISGLNAWNENGEKSDRLSPRGKRVKFDRDFVEQLFLSRHSVRDFDGSIPVSTADLDQAVNLARNSPSVCNRQAWKVRFIRSEELKNKSLSFQNGNSGFGEVPVLAIISVDIRRFSGPGERNQAWIDGGIFSMALSLSLHGLGLASCMLNMSVKNKIARKLKTNLQIPNHEVVIMQMAIGFASPDFRVARATRMPLKDVSIFLDQP